MATCSSFTVKWNMFAIFIFGFLAISLPTTVDARRIGGQKCTWGPSYWCQNIRQSSACSATTHCINNVWNSNPYPEDGDDICKICKEMVKEARDQLQSNETQEELKEVFEGSCDLIPVRIVADYCKKLADEFIPELVETLASEMNPDTVCTVSGLCNSQKIDRLLANYLRTRTNCDVCHEGVNTISKMFKGMDKNDILDKGLSVCGRYMGSYSDACKLSLLENFEDIYEVLANVDDQICEVTPMCSASSKSTPALLSSRDSLECQFCEKVLQHYIDIWSSNQTEQEFKQVLDQICRTLGQPDRINRCLHIVDDYYIPFFNYIIHELNPKAACQTVGLCGSNGFLQIPEDIPVSVLVPFDYPGNVIPPNDNQPGQLIGGYFMPQAVEEMNKPGCVICEFVMHRLREWLQDGHTQDDLEQGLEEICALMPGSVKDQCKNLVDTEGPAIIQFIIDGIQTTEICKLLGICDGSQNVDLGDSLTSFRDEISVQNLNPVVVMKKEDSTCATCNYVVTTVLEQVRNKDNQDEIRNLIESVCRILPSSVDAHCELLVGEYAEKIIELVAQNLTPDEICIALSLCPNPKPKGEACMLCEFAIKELDNIVEDKHNEAEIKKGLEKLCSFLPSKYAAKCDNFVDTYTDMIIDLIAKDLSPDEICAELGLCNDAVLTSIQENLEMMEARNVGGNTQTCMFCKFAIGELDKMLKDKHNEEEIKQALEKLCDALPKNYADQCKTFVVTYTDIIIDMITKDATPEEICQEIGLCDKPTTVVVSNEITSNGGYCEICEFAITKLDEILEDKNNEQEIKDALDSLCAYLPNSIADQCKTFVDTYTDMIIEMLTNNVSPKEICTELGLCPQGYEDVDDSLEDDLLEDDLLEDDFSVENEEDVNDRPYCMMCEYIVGEIDRYITDNRTEESIQETVEQICHLLSAPIRDECKEMVERYSTQLVQMLVSEYTPAQVCAELGLCNKGIYINNNVANDILSNDIPILENDEYNSLESSEEISDELDDNSMESSESVETFSCAMCEFVMNTLEKQIVNNRTLDMVERAVLMVCSYMPSSVADKCEDYVYKYGDEIIKMIVEMEMDPDEVCSELGLCSTIQSTTASIVLDARSVGGRPCIWGREYWCQSLVHAQACGTVDYCNRTNGWYTPENITNDIDL